VRLIPVAAVLLLLCACEQGSPPEDVRTIAVSNPHSDRLKALPVDLQRLGVMRAIRDSGKRCQKVERAAFQQEYRGMAMWVSMCNDGRYWAIFIAPNADLQVRACTEMSTLDLPQCRPLPGPASQQAS
jgi:hypothetical protein